MATLDSRGPVELVSELFTIPVARLLSRNRASTTSQARQIAWWLMYEHEELSLPVIGRRFQKHHTTVLYGIRRVEARRQEDAWFSQMLDDLGGQMASKRCKCGKEVVFARDEKGAEIQLDVSAPTYTYWFDGGQAHCARAGKSVCVSHLATCKHAHEFSRTGRRKEEVQP